MENAARRPPTNDAASLRDTILRLLELLGDRDAQITYERDQEVALPAELLCMWFDDLYHPTSELFQHAFAPHEQRILATFHHRFDEAARTLPDRLSRVADLHARPEWGVVVQAAVDALEALRHGPA